MALKLGSGDKIGLGIFVFLVVVIAIAVASPSNPKSSQQQKTTLTQSAQPTSKPVVETINDKLWKAVDRSLKTRKDVTLEFDEGTAMVSFYRDNYLDENHLVKDAYTAFVNFGIEAFKIPEVQEVNVQSKVDLTDKYGKKTRDTAVSVTMNRETFEKFTWDNLRNIKSANIYQVMKDNAQLHFVSPAILKDIDTNDLWIK